MGFFDHVDHQDLVAEARETNFSMRLVRSLCAVYTGPRVIQVWSAASGVIVPDGTILPGCSNAMTVTKLVVGRLIKSVRAAWPPVNIWNVVDDYNSWSHGMKKP